MSDLPPGAPRRPLDSRISGSRCYPTYVLLLLAAANVMNAVDKNLVGLLAELIKRDLNLSDTALGILAGSAYAGAFLLAGIPIARWADRGDRRRILALGIGFWSLMTAVFGLGTGFWMLLIARIGVGIGEAAAVPTSMSLIADYFSPEKRTRAVSVFQSAAFLGLIATVVTGLIAHHYGWRAAFMAAGAVGILLALLVYLTVIEPRARAAADHGVRTATSGSLLAASRLLLGNRVFVLIVVGVTAGAVSAASLSSWGSAFLIRIHELSIVQVASALGPASGIGGFLGTLAGGYATSWAVQRTGNRQWMLFIPGMALLLAVPAAAVFLFAETPALAITMFGVQAFLWAVKTGPCFSLAMELVPTGQRAFAVSVLVVVGGAVGTGLAPPLVGYLSDTLGDWQDGTTLRNALVVAPVALLVSGLALLSASRMLK